MGIGFFPPRCSVPQDVNLSGDTNGLSSNNRTTSLSEQGLAIELVPINDLDGQGSVRVLVVDDTGPPEIRTEPLPRTEYDHILESRAELVAAVGAPVAGEFLLTAGSYFVKTGFALNAGERIVVDGVDVMWKNGGLSKVLSGDVADSLFVSRNGGRVQLLFASMLNNNAAGSAFEVASDGEAQSWGCVLQGNTGVLTSGPYQDTASLFQGGTGPAVQFAGDLCVVEGSRIIAGSGNAIVHNAVAAGSRFTLDTCFVEGFAANVIEIDSLGSDLSLDNVRIASSFDNGDIIHVDAASTIQITGGRWAFTSGTLRGNGLVADGDITGGLMVNGLKGQNIGSGDATGEAMFVYASGVTDRASFIGCDTASDVLTFINWPAANIPPSGLVLVGNTWDDTDPIVGFTETDTDVNMKANCNAFGPMAETPIVP